jgi:hypothetical protein
LGADSIVFGDFGELGPLDVQLTKPDELVSTSSGLDNFQALGVLTNSAFEAFETYLIKIIEASEGHISAKTSAEIARQLAIGRYPLSPLVLVQLTTDGLRAYLKAVEGAFGADVDYAQLVKIYGAAPESAKGRYSPAECAGIVKTRIEGNPDDRHISTSFVERQVPGVAYSAPSCLSGQGQAEPWARPTLCQRPALRRRLAARPRPALRPLSLPARATGPAGRRRGREPPRASLASQRRNWRAASRATRRARPDPTQTRPPGHTRRI